MVKADGAGLEEAVRVLKAGGVAVIPTDTVYGLAAHPDCPEAVARLSSLKGRPSDKPIALLASDVMAVENFLGGLEAQPRRLAKLHWPGALTLVLPSSNGTFEGVRVPNYVFTRELISRCGGVLRVTSANESGCAPATDAALTFENVGLGADIVVDDGLSPGGEASTVAKSDKGELVLLREGPVAFNVLASASPRRAKILRDHGVDFIVVKTDVEEVTYPGDPGRTVRENALAKGAAVKSRGHVIAADTIVWLNGKIYGKPRDLDEARAFLRELSGNVHSVYTAVVCDGDVKTVRSDVAFRVLSDEVIEDYVTRVCPLDRAGAYDIDDSGFNLISSYSSGGYENIMGLPVEPLREWGIVS